MADKTMCNENVEKSHSHNNSDQIYYSSALGTVTSNASDEELRDVKKRHLSSSETIRASSRSSSISNSSSSINQIDSIDNEISNKTPKIQKKNLPDESDTHLSLSRDSSLESQPASYLEAKSFLIETLKKSLKDRQFLYKIENDLNQFLNDEKINSLKFSQSSSYNRMLIHKAADYFQVDHNVDTSRSAIIVTKNSQTKLPKESFKQLILQTSEDYKFSPKKSILKRDSNSFEDSSSSTSFEKDKSPDDSNLIAAQKHSFKSRSLEEREQHYEKVRARIFNEESSPSTLKNTDNINDAQNSPHTHTNFVRNSDESHPLVQKRKDLDRNYSSEKSNLAKNSVLCKLSASPKLSRTNFYNQSNNLYFQTGNIPKKRFENATQFFKNNRNVDINKQSKQKNRSFPSHHKLVPNSNVTRRFNNFINDIDRMNVVDSMRSERNNLINHNTSHYCNHLHQNQWIHTEELTSHPIIPNQSSRNFHMLNVSNNSDIALNPHPSDVYHSSMFQNFRNHEPFYWNPSSNLIHSSALPNVSNLQNTDVPNSFATNNQNAIHPVMTDSYSNSSYESSRPGKSCPFNSNLLSIVNYRTGSESLDYNFNKEVYHNRQMKHNKSKLSPMESTYPPPFFKHPYSSPIKPSIDIPYLSSSLFH
ncbi:V-type proton ATPase [Sarcoptes scabiei]|nr:V-type proton ATPase [Sarcoptes scabiei]